MISLQQWLHFDIVCLVSLSWNSKDFCCNILGGNSGVFCSVLEMQSLFFHIFADVANVQHSDD
jgi:hypothetical protein